MKHSKNAFFHRQEKNSFTQFFKGTAGWLCVGALLAFAVVLLIAFRPAYANTDWHDNDLREQISRAEQIRRAKEIWCEENPCFQPNLTPAAEKELRAYTAQKQAEIDRTLGRNPQ